MQKMQFGKTFRFREFFMFGELYGRIVVSFLLFIYLRNDAANVRKASILLSICQFLILYFIVETFYYQYFQSRLNFAVLSVFWIFIYMYNSSFADKIQKDIINEGVANLKLSLFNYMTIFIHLTLSCICVYKLPNIGI